MWTGCGVVLVLPAARQRSASRAEEHDENDELAGSCEPGRVSVAGALQIKQQQQQQQHNSVRKLRAAGRGQDTGSDEEWLAEARKRLLLPTARDLEPDGH